MWPPLAFAVRSRTWTPMPSPYREWGSMLSIQQMTAVITALLFALCVHPAALRVALHSMPGSIAKKKKRKKIQR